MFRTLLEACRSVGNSDGTARVQAAVEWRGLVALAPIATATDGLDATVAGSAIDIREERCTQAAIGFVAAAREEKGSGSVAGTWRS